MKKRVRATANKKLVMKKACLQHLLINKSKRQKRFYRKKGVKVHETFEKDVLRMLPYL